MTYNVFVDGDVKPYSLTHSLDRKIDGSMHTVNGGTRNGSFNTGGRASMSCIILISWFTLYTFLIWLLKI